MKKWVYAASIPVIGSVVFVTFLVWDQNKRYRSHLEEVRALQKIAVASGQRAQSLAETGNYDLRVSINRRLLNKAFQAFQGFERLSSKGNRIVFHEAKVSLADGEIRVNARGDFTARRGLYQGPVTVSYAGFTQILDDGTCHLDFRALQAKPLDKPWFPHWLVEPWLVLRLQNKMRLPQIDLPLDIEREIVVPAIEKIVSKRQITLKVPGRKLSLSAENPNVLVSPDSVDILVGNLVLDGNQTKARPSAPVHHPVSDEDLRIELRIALLDEILAKVIDRDEDLFLEAELIENVWRQKKKVLGLTVNNHADLSNLEGTLDIRETRLEKSGDQWELDLEVHGLMTGTASGKAYGISHSAPFVLTSYFRDQLPICFLADGNNLTIEFEDIPLNLPLEIETRFAGRRIHFKHLVETTTGEILQPIHLSQWLEAKMRIPVYMEGKKIAEYKEFTADINWRIALPEAQPGYLIIGGTLAQLNPITSE